jgi:hypothetical protein
MGRCVAAQHLLAAYVICVIGAAADVICWDQDLVKVCFACDDWEHVVKVLVESWLGLVKVVTKGLWVCGCGVEVRERQAGAAAVEKQGGTPIKERGAAATGVRKLAWCFH